MVRCVYPWLPFLLLALTAAGCDSSTTHPGGDAGACTVAADCDDGVACNGAERCEAGACVAGTPLCAAGTRCDEDLGQCVLDCEDADGDGFTAIACGGTDCDDTDGRRFPGATEVCDSEGIDEDCDETTVGTLDADADGAISNACCNGERCGTDCDDGDSERYPGRIEICNRVDEDCDGDLDEGLPLVTLFADGDGDGVGDAPALTCGILPGIVALDGDCDDTDDEIAPGVAERCDDVDEDCDGEPDDGCPSDAALGEAFDGVTNIDPMSFARAGGIECGQGEVLTSIFGRFSNDQGLWRYSITCRSLVLRATDGADGRTFSIDTDQAGFVYGPTGDDPGGASPGTCPVGGTPAFSDVSVGCPSGQFVTGLAIPNGNTRRLGVRCSAVDVVDDAGTWRLAFATPTDSNITATCRFDNPARFDESAPRVLVGVDFAGRMPITSLRARYRELSLETIPDGD